MRRPLLLPTMDELRALAAEHGIEHVGVAPATVMERARRVMHERADAGLAAGMGFTYNNPDRATDPQRAVAEARSVIVAARCYLSDDEPPRPAGPQARVARYAWVDHYRPLRDGLRAMARRIRAADHRAVPYADDNSIVDREVAHRAGIGWFGKHANLMLPGAGSWFVLGSVVTTAEYRVAAEPVKDGCGTCTRCLTACPTGAIVAPGVIDANRCLAWVLQQPGSIRAELRAAIGDRIYGCDDCQDACPPTVRLGRRHERPLDPAAEAWVDVLALLDADDQTLLDRHGRWYIAGREPRWLRRNALVVLGNTADAEDRRVQQVLARYRHHDDPILAEHAAWASQQLGLLTPASVVMSTRHASGSSSEVRVPPFAGLVEPVARVRQASESSSELGGDQGEPEHHVRQVSESSIEVGAPPFAGVVEPVAGAREARESSSELGGDQGEPEK